MGARTRGLANNVLSSGKLDATDAISGNIAAGNIANASLNNATTFGSVSGGVPQVAGDPPSPADGDIWYNTNTGTLRFRGRAGSWASGGNLNTAKQSLQGGNVGIQTAALTFGGAASPGDVAQTESYNGTSWTELNDMGTARNQMMRSGVQTSAMAIAGGTTFNTNVESWDGTNWTEVAELNTNRRAGGGAGASNTSTLVFGGQTPPAPANTVTANTESWNGSAWTEVNNLNTAKNQLAGTGTQTAALSFSGRTPAPARDLQQNEIWDGTSWTESADPNEGRENASASGTTTSGIAFGGRNDPVRLAVVEEWDGTAWTEVADLATAREQLGGSGASSASALAYGGEGPSAYLTTTEEYSYIESNFTVG